MEFYLQVTEGPFGLQGREMRSAGAGWRRILYVEEPDRVSPGDVRAAEAAAGAIEARARPEAGFR